MSWLTSLVASLARLLARLGTCANGGLIAGMVAGGSIALLDFIEGPLQLTVGEALRFWLVLALAAWLVLIFVFVALVRWSFASVALPTLLNAVLVSGLTVAICRLLAAYGWGWLIGILVGLLVGLLLCALSRWMR